jgi:predicted nucleic acid-binding Zn finger protein
MVIGMVKVQTIEALYRRLERARAIVAAGKILPVAGRDGYFCVLASDGKRVYLVQAGQSCTCPDFTQRSTRSVPCKHLLAVELYQNGKASGNGAVSGEGEKVRPPVRVVRPPDPDEELVVLPPLDEDEVPFPV